MKPLSEKQVCMPDKDEDYHGYNALMTKDVAEAVEKLKRKLGRDIVGHRVRWDSDEIIEEIDKIFGSFE